MTISQEVVNGVAVYRFNNNAVIADGVLRPIGDNSDFKGQIRYSCENGSLVKALTAFVPGSWSVERYGRDTQGNLTTTQYLVFPNGATSQVSTDSCIRQ